MGLGLLGGGESATDAPPDAAPAPPTDPLAYPEQGLRMARPRGWTAERRRGLIRLRAGDGSTSVSVVTAAPDADPRALARTAERAVGRRVSAPTVRRRTVLALGGVRAPATELRGRSASGAQLDVVIAVASGRWRTYAVTAVRAGTAPAERLEEVGRVLASMQFHRPRE